MAVSEHRGEFGQDGAHTCVVNGGCSEGTAQWRSGSLERRDAGEVWGEEEVDLRGVEILRSGF